MDTVSNRDVSQHLHGSALVQSSSGDVILTLYCVFGDSFGGTRFLAPYDSFPSVLCLMIIVNICGITLFLIFVFLR